MNIWHFRWDVTINPIFPLCQFFDRYILTDRALKLILYDFSSNLILNM